MQFKSFMEALKGKQHKIDKNKNGEIDAHDFKLLRKEESEETTETIEESEERQALADYKVGASGRKSHKEIVFGDAESEDEEEDKKEMKEAKMSDADMKERERLVKGMKKNLAGFKARYGSDAKSVMYATATKQAMKEEAVDEAMNKADVPAYLRKQRGEKPLTMADVKAAPKDSISHPDNLAKARGAVKEEAEEIDERSDQAKQNKTMKNLRMASKGAQINLGLKLDPADYGYKKSQHLNKAIGRAAMRAEATVPFDGPYTKTKPTKNSDGTPQEPMSRARELAKQAMKKQMKEDIDRLFEKDEQEYGYEGDMAMNQLATLTRCAEMIKDILKPDTDLPEWVQSKITLATDYIVTAADYLHSELEEQAPVAPVPDRKYIKGTPEHKAYKATKKPINGMPTNVKEEIELDEVERKTLSYTDFVTNLLEYETKDGRYVNKGTYGGSYVDPEGADDADDKKPKQKPAEKRGRGRPAGAKSGAGKITGTSKLYK